MKKIVLIICFMFVTLSLCGCQNNKVENNIEEIKEIVFPNGGILDGGRLKYFDANPEKTPLIHEALLMNFARNYKESLNKMLEALEMGEFDPLVYHFLGNYYHLGLGVEKDDDIAFEYFSKGVEYNQSFCVYDLGNIYNDRGDLNKAYEQYEKAIELGDPRGYCRLIKRDVSRDPDSVETYINKLVESNDIGSINYAGNVLLEAKYDNKNLVKAFELYTIAANLGSTDGLHNMGLCYEKGYGTEKDPEKAFEYYLKAAETYEFADYYIYVGYCYEYGIGVEKDIDKAIEYYELSTKDGDGSGWSDIGYIYEQGKSVDRDYYKALEYYTLGYTAPIANETALERYNRLKAIIKKAK